jgi:4'-phosphopantetheinyl transferase
MLAEYLEEEPEEIKLSEGEFGKPHLSDHLQPDALCFNVSHAGDLLLLAFARGCEVGVDLEQLRGDLSYRTIAECYFSRREKEELFSLPSSEQISAFYRCWTRKEAYLKGTGSGFSQPSNGFDVSLLPHRPAQMLAHRASPGHPAAWTIRDVTVPEGFCAAVAFEASLSEVLPGNRQELEHAEKPG